MNQNEFNVYTKTEKKKLGELLHLTWGFGIEHEMQIYHIPEDNDSKNIIDFILFDSKSAVERVKKAYQKGELELTNEEFDFIENMVFETSGRKCSGKWIVKAPPYEMPEFITWKPFCNMRTGRNIHNLTQNVQYVKDIFFEIIMKEKITKELVKNYGELYGYPYGMTRYMSVPKKRIQDKYIFSMTEKKRPIVRTDYTGSYHLTITLPHSEKTTEKKFIEQHKNYANQLQWLEPLLLVGFFSGDEAAIGSKEKRVRGSYRVMIIGWGNLVGSDIRLFDTEGIGRYAKTKNYWRKGLEDLYEAEKIKPCLPPSPPALKEKGITSLSSDLRTFGSRDPERPQHRESGLPMNKPNGIEFRIFDNFSSKDLKKLTSMIGLVAENSRIKKTKGYVYQDKDWIDSLHQIMRYGYQAELPIGYIKKLREKLGLKIKTKSLIANDIFQEVYYELYHKNKNGKWTKILFGIKKGKTILKQTMSIAPEINLDSSIYAFMMKSNREANVLQSFNQLSFLLNQISETRKKISYEDFKNYVIQIMGKNWEYNIMDILHTYDYIQNFEEKDICKVEKNKKGYVEEIIFLKDNIPMIHNFNEYILSKF